MNFKRGNRELGTPVRKSILGHLWKPFERKRNVEMSSKLKNAY